MRAALDAARDAGADSVALPAISAGVFGYPPDEAGAVIGDEAVAWLVSDPGDVTEIRLVGIDDDSAGHFAAHL